MPEIHVLSQLTGT